MIGALGRRINALAWKLLTPRVITLFHKLIYTERGSSTWQNTKWMGAPVQKIPFDLWVQQEIIHETRPQLIIETGTYDGGSSLFYAHLFDILGEGEVISIDVSPQANLPKHPRITFITAASVEPEVVAEVSERAQGKRVMVILDSDHSERHVRKELDAWSGLVSSGCYLIVEDTNVYGHPVCREHGPGPMEALMAWLKTNPPFDIDASREKYMVTFQPNGYLKRR